MAAAVAHDDYLSGLGLDVESRARAMRPGLGRFILTSAEQARLYDALPGQMDPLRLVFSAKEAIHKCVAPMSGVTLGFHDVELDFTIAGCFSARLVGKPNDLLPAFTRLSGRYAVTADYVAATVIASPAG